MKRKRTTHSELADILDDIERRLGEAPRSIVVGVNDEPTRAALRRAASVLYEQDQRIDKLFVALREACDNAGDLPRVIEITRAAMREHA